MNQEPSLLLNISKMLWFTIYVMCPILMNIKVNMFTVMINSNVEEKTRYKGKVYYIATVCDYTLSHTLTDYPPPYLAHRLCVGLILIWLILV